MNFDTKNVQDAPRKKYVRPGVNEDVQIGSIEGVKPETGSPYIDIKFFIAGGKIEDATRSRVYMSESALKMSLMKLNHIATKVVSKEEFDAAGAGEADVVQYGRKLNALLAGKIIPRMMFTAEEYRNQSGEVKVRPGLGLPPFAEATKEGPTSLKYDPQNKYHYKKLAQPDAEPAGAAPRDDMPF